MEYLSIKKLRELLDQMPPERDNMPVYINAYEGTPVPMPARFEPGNSYNGVPVIVLVPLTEDEMYG